MNPLDSLAEASTALVAHLPVSTSQAIADAINGAAGAGLTTAIAQAIPNLEHRARAYTFVDRYQKEFSEAPVVAVASAIKAASQAWHKAMTRQTVELVWTGPATASGPFRRTEQAILQLLETARRRITLVSYAVYSVPNVAKALVAAAQRGVKLTVILETPDRLGGENEYNTLKALGEAVVSAASVYYWPKEKRKEAKSGKVGLLHVKCAIADGEWLLISSANLTHQAFTVNMEMGVLLCGGEQPKAAESHFDRLVNRQVLELV